MTRRIDIKIEEQGREQRIKEKKRGEEMISHLIKLQGNRGEEKRNFCGENMIHFFFFFELDESIFLPLWEI